MKKLLLTLLLVLGVAGMANGETLLSAGFETSEGYSDSSDGSDELLCPGYLGGTSNQQGWYGEVYFGKSASHETLVSDDYAHTGTQSMKIPYMGYYYDYNCHLIADSNHGYKMIGVGKLVAKEVMGEDQLLLEPFRFSRYEKGKLHPESNSPFPWS